MRKHSLIVIFLAIAVLLPVVALSQIAEPNVNMVAGKGWPGGDPFLQRQNEPSVAISTRNPLHLLAGANDYRTVDLPGLPDGDETGDAWLGVFTSRNGGQSWWSTLLPGYPQEAASTSPLHGFQAAADPVVRAGANGMFYYSGIVLNRDPKNPLGGVFVARFIDNNNTENGNPIAYLGASMIDTGTSGQFLDKLWIAVAPGSGTCTLQGQTFPGQNVYVAFTRFVGDTTNIRTKIMFARSADCGTTWSLPTKLSEGYSIDQGATIAADSNGTVYVAWRRFKSGNDVDAILVAKSTDQGRTFGKASVVTAIDPFDQGMTATSIRTNAYPSIALDGSGRLYAAWSDRRFESHSDGRIVVASSPDGTNWSQPSAIEPLLTTRGHQFMPALSVAGDKMIVAYYDLREDHTRGIFTPSGGGRYLETRQWVADSTDNVFLRYLMDSAPSPLPRLTRRHTLDLRAAQSNTGPMLAFTSARVSRYTFGSRPRSSLIEQLQFNVPNFPMFKLGTAPFLGDYIDVSSYALKSSHVHHVVWTDNRDVRPPKDGNWANYTPARSSSNTGTSTLNGQPVPQCIAGQTGMRNQNIYTARVTDGLFAGSPGNAKPLGKIQRAFVVFVQNATAQTRSFRLTAQPPDPQPGQASFSQFAYQQQLDVTVPPRSTATRSVFVNAVTPRAKVVIDVAEINGGLSSTVILNPDVSNPDVSNPDVSNPDVSNPDVSNPDVSNPDVSNAEVHNPDVSNPDVSNPDVSNPDVSNPDVSNPDVSNPDVSNPDVSNPDVSNPDVSNPDVSNAAVTDTTWTVRNTGNTTSGYTVKLASSQPLPNGVRAQLIINRVYQTPAPRPAADGYPSCDLQMENRRQIVANILDPQFTSLGLLSTIDPADASLSLAPGDGARLTLRVYNQDPAHVSFDPKTAIIPAVIAHAANTLDAANNITTPRMALPLFITTTSLPDGVAGIPYSATVTTVGGAGTRTWTVLSPAGLTISAAGVLSGTLAAGDSLATVSVFDTTNHQTSRTLSLHIAQPLTITTATLPDATWGVPYAASASRAGGTGAVTWSAAGLPVGLTVGALTGALSGTPAGSGVVTASVNLAVTDSASPAQSATKSGLTINLADPLVIDTTVLPDGVVGTPYGPVAVQSHGGLPPYTVTATGLPVGLTLVNGTISGTPSAAATSSVSIVMTDSGHPARSSSTPLLSLRIALPLTVSTTPLPDATWGVPYSASLTSTGGTGVVTWNATGLPAGLTFGASTGVLSGTPSGTGTSASSVTVTATDSATPPQSSTKSGLAINVADPLVIDTTVLPDGVVGTPYGPVTVQSHGGLPPYTVTATGLPAGLTLVNGTVVPKEYVISGTPSAAATSSVSILVTDSGHPARSSSTPLVSLRIAPPLIVSTTPLPDATWGVAYSASVTSTGGTGTVTWGAIGLPTGLTLGSSTGILSGTPSGSGTAASIVTITATDSATPAQSSTRSLTIKGADPILIDAPALPDGVVGIAYGPVIAPAHGGLPPYTWTATGLPGGLTFVNGTISGTPTAAATTTVSLIVTDSGYPARSSSTPLLSLRIAPFLAIAGTTLPDATWGVAYSASLTSTGGTGPVTWNATGLPAGLTLGASTGLVSGTPSGSGTAASTVMVTGIDSATPPQSFTRSLTINVANPLLNDVTVLPDGVVGIAYGPTTVSAHGGLPPYTWTATGLPAGLTFVNGTISGTPTGAATSTVSFTVTDSGHPPRGSSSPLLSLRIAPLLAIATTTLPDATWGVAYSANLSSTGGTGAVTWSASGLPAGVTVGPSTGVLSGTPSGSGAATTTVNIAAIDSASPAQSGGKSLTLRIADALVLDTNLLPDGVVNTPYGPVPLQIHGGVAPYTITAAGLPGGLTLLNGTISGTPTTAGTSPISITVSDAGNPARIASATLTLTIALTPAPSAGVTPPSVAAGFGQLVAIDGVNFTSSTSAIFSDGVTAGSGSVVTAASTATRLYVRLPFVGDGRTLTNLRLGSISFSLKAGSTTIQRGTLILSSVPGTPVISAIYSLTTAPSTNDRCGSGLSGSPINSVPASRAIAVSALGVDTVGAGLRWVQGATTLYTDSTCAFTTSALGVGPVFSAPPALQSGRVDVSIRTTVNGKQSGWSAPLTLRVQ